MQVDIKNRVIRSIKKLICKFFSLITIWSFDESNNLRGFDDESALVASFNRW